jgi:hypothetical protein
MPLLKKIAKAVAEKSPAGKAVSKANPMVGGFLGKTVSNAMQSRGVAVPNAKKGSSTGGSGLIGKALKARGFENGGKVDKAGRALGKKTPDAMGRAMAKAPMKKNMGGMAKKSSKKC